ncbi:MAG: lipoate--protein ligase family protein, partial [Gemmatimonadales bacterium]
MIDQSGRPGWANMAIDQGLLDLAEATGSSFLRLYRWDPPCLSFGRNEAALRRYDRARIGALAVATVRRPTGGRAVWHAGELTYAVAAPIESFGSLPAAYREIHEMVAAALRLLGAAPVLAPSASRTPSLEAGACFARPVGGEVLVQGHKVVGSAQLRQGAAFLQHGSLLLEGDQEPITALSLGEAQAGRAGGGSLSRLLGRRIEFDAAATALSAA